MITHVLEGHGTKTFVDHSVNLSFIWNLKMVDTYLVNCSFFNLREKREKRLVVVDCNLN